MDCLKQAVGGGVLATGMGAINTGSNVNLWYSRVWRWNYPFSGRKPPYNLPRQHAHFLILS